MPASHPQISYFIGKGCDLGTGICKKGQQHLGTTGIDCSVNPWLTQAKNLELMVGNMWEKGDTQEPIYLDRIISKLGGSVACMVKQALSTFSEFSSQWVRALSFYLLGLHLALGKAFIPAQVWPKVWVLFQWQCWCAIEWEGWWSYMNLWLPLPPMFLAISCFGF